MAIKNTIRLTFNFWLCITIMFTLFFCFESGRLFDVATGYYDNTEMVLEKVVFFNSSTNPSRIVYGRIDTNKVEATVEPDSLIWINKYLEKVVNNYSYDSLYKLNVKIPVVKFDHSNSVLIIPPERTSQYAVSLWLRPNLVLIGFAYIPLIILYILKKIYAQKK